MVYRAVAEVDVRESLAGGETGQPCISHHVTRNTAQSPETYREILQ